MASELTIWKRITKTTEEGALKEYLVEKEKKTAILRAFVISWTPYSIVSLLTAFREVDTISKWVILVPAIVAKFSIIWNPIVYLSRHRDFREACKLSIPWNILRRKSRKGQRKPTHIIKEEGILHPGVRINVENQSDSSGTECRMGGGTDAALTECIELNSVIRSPIKANGKTVPNNMLATLKEQYKSAYSPVISLDEDTPDTEEIYLDKPDGSNTGLKFENRGTILENEIIDGT